MFFNFFRPPVNEITPSDTANLIKDKDTILLDVRTEAEFNSIEYGHIKGSVLIPLQSLLYNKDKLTKHKDKEIIIYCRSGQRSAEACRILDKEGFKTKNMKGGIIKWKQLGYSTEK